MSYHIDWAPRAEQHLAAIWTGSDDRDGVTRAADEIDRVLSRNPLAVGEARESSVHRVVFFDRLAAEFVVIEDDKRVLVQAVFTLG